MNQAVKGSQAPRDSLVRQGTLEHRAVPERTVNPVTPVTLGILDRRDDLGRWGSRDLRDRLVDRVLKEGRVCLECLDRTEIPASQESQAPKVFLDSPE